MEIWKKVDGYSDYEVSNLGRVRSFMFNKERYLKGNISTTGYEKVTLKGTEKIKYFNIHQIVAIAFLNHKPCGYNIVVNHINNIKNDNRVENLELISQRENSNRKHIIGTSKYTGVCWSKGNKKWHSQIVINGKQKNLGHFINEIDAHFAYQKELEMLNLNK